MVKQQTLPKLIARIWREKGIIDKMTYMDLPPGDVDGGNILSDLGARAATKASRYEIREKDGTRELICHESPSIAVRMEKGLSVAAQAVRKFDSGTIFLDGVAQAGPLMDVEKHIYNLDHHQGCIRPFTLAACEQAMVVVRKGLGLQERDWKIYANEPDLVYICVMESNPLFEALLPDINIPRT